jgi:hypothetical protein
MSKPVVSPRCSAPTQQQVDRLQHAVDDILMPAASACYGLLGDHRMVLDAILSLYVNLGVRIEGADAFAETLGEMCRVVPASLPAIEADQQAAGRA